MVSIVLAVCGAACAVAGYFTLWFPVFGALLSFAGPLFASGAIVSGSIAVRRDQRGAARTWRATVGRIGRALGVLMLPPTMVIALTCGALNAAGTVYLDSLFPSYEERQAERRADEARGRAFWRPSGSSPLRVDMPWHLHEGERESEAHRDVRHGIELALELVRIAEQSDDGDAGAGVQDAGIAR